MIPSTPNVKLYQTAQMQKASKTDQLESIKEEHRASQAKQFAQMMSQVQSSVAGKIKESSFEIEYKEFKDFLAEIGYEGKPLASLSQDEAKELVSEEGFFGIQQTSERIAEFVIMGAKGNEELLREGRKGVLQGLKEAEEIWGSSLPDIAYETMDKTLEMIDQALIEGGFSVLNEKV